MPGVFVFPGGKVDQADRTNLSEAKRVEVLPEANLNGLECDVDAYVSAGLRELSEETGYELSMDSLRQVGDMRLIARAITPPYPGPRYDTLFLLLQVERPKNLDPKPDSAELEQLGWFTLQATQELPIAGITRRIQSQGIEVAGRGEITKFLQTG